MRESGMHSGAFHFSCPSCSAVAARCAISSCAARLCGACCFFSVVFVVIVRASRSHGSYAKCTRPFAGVDTASGGYGFVDVDYYQKTRQRRYRDLYGTKQHDGDSERLVSGSTFQV